MYEITGRMKSPDIEKSPDVCNFRTCKHPSFIISNSLECWVGSKTYSNLSKSPHSVWFEAIRVLHLISLPFGEFTRGMFMSSGRSNLGTDRVVSN